MTSSVGAIEPSPIAAESTFRPRTDSSRWGMPLFEPGVSSSASTGSAAVNRIAAALAAKSTGRRMIVRASRGQKLRSPRRRSTTAFGISRTRSSGSASQCSRPGSSVSAASTDTVGMRRPAIPKPRRKGSGIASISASPMATAVPLKTTALPAVSIVRTIASSLASPPRRSSR